MGSDIVTNSSEERDNHLNDSESDDAAKALEHDIDKSALHASPTMIDDADQTEDNKGSEITFVAFLGDMEESPRSGAEGWNIDETMLLLPAWSSTTLRSRTPVPSKLPEAVSPHSRTRSCIAGVIAAIVVLSLLGSSLFSLYWFWDMRSQRLAAVTAGLDGGSGHQAENLFERSTPNEEFERVQPVASPAANDKSKRVNRIVYIDNQRQIVTIDPDGSDQRQLTSDGISYLFPAWSPDGSSIAALGNSFSGGGLYIINDAEGGEDPRELYSSRDDNPFYVYWSPNSGQISFLANGPSTLTLNVVETTGDDTSRIVAIGSPMYWNWAINSEEMLLHSGGSSEDSQLLMIDVYGRGLTQRVPSPGLFQAPGISPSGRYWAYSQFRAGGTAWLVIDDRSSRSQHTQRHAGSVALNWSPVRDELAFLSGGTNNQLSYWGPLRLMDAASGNIRLLSSDLVVAFFWSPDGEKIATISVPTNDRLGEEFEVHDTNESRSIRYLPGRDPLSAAQLRPHTFEINVIDVASGEGLQLAEVSLSSIFLSQFLPFFDQYGFSHNIWSPDSSSLILPVVTNQRSEITVVDTRNGRMIPLAEGRIGFWSRQ